MLKTIFLEALEDFKNIDLPQALYSDDPIECGVPEREDICPLKDALGHAARIFKYAAIGFPDGQEARSGIGY